MMIIFSFCKFFVIMDGTVPMSCFRLKPFLKRAKGFFTTDLPVILLEYFLNLVTLDYMLLIMACIVYYDAFVGGAVNWKSRKVD